SFKEPVGCRPCEIQLNVVVGLRWDEWIAIHNFERSIKWPNLLWDKEPDLLQEHAFLIKLPRTPPGQTNAVPVANCVLRYGCRRCPTADEAAEHPNTTAPRGATRLWYIGERCVCTCDSSFRI